VSAGQIAPFSSLKQVILGEFLPSIQCVRHCEIDSVARAPKSDDVTQSKQNHRDRVRPFGSLWSVSEGANEDNENDTNVELEENFEDNLASSLR